MRFRYVYDKGEVIFAQEGDKVLFDKRDHAQEAGYYFMPDIEPYQSMADGSIVHSRSGHREMLKRNHCFEVGNETSHLKPADLRGTGQKEALIHAVQQAKEKHGSRFIERELTSALNRAHEMERHKR